MEMMEDDIVTIATTSDCSEDRGPPVIRYNTTVEFIAKGTFWCFILICFLLLSVVVIWPIVLSPYTIGADPWREQNNLLPKTELRAVQFFLTHEKGYSLNSTVYNASSAQYQAAIFMMTQSLPKTKKEELEWKQRYAVACMYYSTSGPDWKHPLYYFLNDLYRVCDWGESIFNGPTLLPIGVFCDDNKKVTGMVFFDNGLRGLLPKQEMLLLTDLEMLYLNYNPELTETMSELLSKLPPSLREFEMIGSNVQGDIPSEISNFTDLQILSMGYNRLTGSIPHSISKLKELNSLSLEDNLLTGELMTPLNELSNLREVYLENNDFKDVLTEDFLYKNSILSQLDLSDNPQVRGAVPIHLPSLAVLDAHGTSMDYIPSDVQEGESSKLDFLALHGNPNLVGTFPSQNFPSLTHLDLTSCTGLTGDMPRAGMTNLQYLFLAHTNFTAGTIPQEFSELTKLIDLSLKDSKRTGSIPPDLVASTSLVLLDLDDNDLTGTIPSQLFRLPDLNFLLLNRNRLNGTIPSSILQANSLKLLLLNDNLLTGGVSSDLSSLHKLKYLFLQNNPLLTGEIINSKCHPDLIWQVDCETTMCTCCTCCDDDDDVIDTSDDAVCDLDGNFLLQYENILWYHRYQRQQYSFISP